MNIRDAFLKAADHIEANPGSFAYSAIYVPTSSHCGSPGCALGWIAFFLGTESVLAEPDEDGDRTWILGDVLGVSDLVFYERMDEVGINGWRVNAETCARSLRRYADAYHPAPEPKRTGIPSDVLAIFDSPAPEWAS